MHIFINATRLELIEGDIADQEVDAIVNAAHPDLLGGQGVDGAIHFKAGPQLLEECRAIGGCPIGEAVITSGGRLKARWVIHTVGPVYEDGADDYEAGLLACAYRNSLKLAVAHGVRAIAFPALSTGAFCYPMEQAAPIALGSVIDFLRTESHDLELVRFVLYPDENPEALAIHERALQELTDHAHHP